MNLKYRMAFMLLSLLGVLASVAEVPAGYYSSCEGKSGQALLKALYEKISSHTNVGYDGLWEVYRKSDVRADGGLWDIYSTKQWGSNFTRCGNYSVIGDCVNREHSLPKSWWGGGKATQYSDAFHLYPTDGKVNGQRSNYPFGECANGTKLASNGSVQPLGRLGNCTFPGYTGTVFEPDDQYKGDLARSYFYMAACYNGIISGWTSGDGGKVFAGNSYPVFTTWSLNLLLKWARQDQVSQKELDRNEAIYTFQHNRNPFIDYPELIEYVWGDKNGEAWYIGGSKDPAFQFPVQNTTVNLGMAARGVARSTQVYVKAVNLTSSVSIQAGGCFSVTPATLTAAQANEGTYVTVTVNSPDAGDAEGILTLRSGSVTRSVDLYCEIIDGLPAAITDVTSEGFTLTWLNMNEDTPSATYTVDILQGSTSVSDFPRNVAASDERLVVAGLDSETDYTVTFRNLPGGMEAPLLRVTTSAPVPSIQLLFDGDLLFDAAPGEPSDIAELLLEVDNIPGDISVAVKVPFEVSTDKAAWSSSITLTPEEDRFYLRMGASVGGDYETPIVLSSGTYVNDDAFASGSVAAPSTFLEDWEVSDDVIDAVPCYSSTSFMGRACSWNVTDGGFGSGSQDRGFNGTTALRMGKKSNSTIAMAQDKNAGIGRVTFDASKWPSTSEADAVINIDYSADGGMTWTTIESLTVESTSAKSFTVDVSRPGNGRIRFAQTAGGRWFIDNIAITDHSAMGAVAELDYHKWDAFSRNGLLVIESRDSDRTISVYGIDGKTWAQRKVSGEALIALPAGLYVVTDGDFARRVLVK